MLLSKQQMILLIAPAIHKILTFSTDPNVTLTANKTGVAHDVVAEKRRPVNSFTEVVTSIFKNTGSKDVVAVWSAN